MQLSKLARSPSDTYSEKKDVDPGCARLASESRLRVSVAPTIVRILIAASVALIVCAQSATAQEQTAIIDFEGYEEPSGNWLFTGQVIAEEPVGMVVTFGGLLEGHSITVDDPAGLFEYRATITQSGVVTAQTDGSEQVEFFVDL